MFPAYVLRSARMRLTVIAMNSPMTPTISAINTASHQWNDQASNKAQLTPSGVVTSKMGLAIRKRPSIRR
jgi:hypothetical protein